MTNGFDGSDLRIAVVGMSARLPGAETIDAFWSNLCAGTESITFFEKEDLSGTVQASLLEQPNYVRARGVLRDLEKFDAACFGLSPREAALLDPQQRLLLECAWEALDVSGCAREAETRLCGVYAGTGMNGYLLHNIWSNQELFRSLGGFEVLVGNDKDFCATRISYKLNLRGPSLTVQTACSTSLVAVHLACQALLQGECDLALAGSCSAFIPQQSGYLYEPTMILSPDGHCRPFDGQANGTVPSSGAVMVVLKRLEDAKRDGNEIHAVILGSAVNNDGAIKVGYTAPSVEGQRAVIAEALAVAQVMPDSIGYIEAHGTATLQGDPIEFEALKKVFASSTRDRGTCALGSVKSNLGHLDSAAGIAGLVKAILALRHDLIPGTLHFASPNPALDLDSSPFFVPVKPVPWNSACCRPRRAGVSSFGVGGTNAHVVLEEPPVRILSKNSRKHHVFVCSAKSRSALAISTQQLADHLRAKPECDVGDVAFALNAGRRLLKHRRLIRARSRSELINELGEVSAPEDILQDETTRRRIVFLFPDQPAYYPGMASGIYAAEPRFRKHLDRCSEILGFKLDTCLWPPSSLTDAQDRYAALVLFAVQYAFGRCLVEWGIIPAGMLGYGRGEWVVGCLAEVISLEDALRTTAERACPCDSKALTSQAQKKPNGRTELRAPKVRFLSHRTGRWITAEEATDDEYWTEALVKPSHPRDSPVRLPDDSDQVLLEIGPGTDDFLLVSRQSGAMVSQRVLPAFPSSRRANTEAEHLTMLVGKLQLAGVPINWAAFYEGEGRQRLWLPAHPFQRERCWIDSISSNSGADTIPAVDKEHREALSEWLYLPSWRRSIAPEASSIGRLAGKWLLVGVNSAECNHTKTDALEQSLTAQLQERGADVTLVRSGEHLVWHSAQECTAQLTEVDDWRQILESLRQSGSLQGIVFFEQSAGFAADWGSHDRTEQCQKAGYHHFRKLGALVHALGRVSLPSKIRLLFITREFHVVCGTEQGNPWQALACGILRVIPQEYPNIICQNIDLEAGAFQDSAQMLNKLVAEITFDSADHIVAYRRGYRWVPSFEQIGLSKHKKAPRLREGGTYLISGGLGGIGLTLAKHLAASYRAKLVLISRSGFPPREEWESLSKAADSTAGQRASTLLEIERVGGETLIIRADVAVENQMAKAIAESEHRFGEIHGVIHCAGVPGGNVLAAKTGGLTTAVMRAKVDGTRVLHHLFRTRRPDFIILCSSVSSWLGGVGQAEYCAANAFLDAYAEYSRKNDEPIFSVGWDAWREVGMAVATEVPEDLRRLREEELGKYGLTPHEGITVFEEVLRLGFPQVLVSTRDFFKRYANRNEVITEGLEKLRLSKRDDRHPRPDLEAEFVSPRNDFERRIAERFCENLGFYEIGIHDNYFDLGGDSLKGITLVSVLQQDLGETVHVAALFEAPTVAELTDYFAKHYPATVSRFNLPADLSLAKSALHHLDRDTLETLRQRIPVLQPYPRRLAKKNPRAVFVLSAPRSGSTLLRVMLAGHPKLFAPPELALLSFNTLRERRAGFASQFESLLDGPIHALRQSLNCTVEHASARVAEWEKRDLSCKECYFELQRLIQDRLLVDKTPSYAYDLETLRRGESDFERPLYIHLVRHPGGMIHSFEQAKMDLLLPGQVRAGLELTRLQLAEAIWLISNENILRFLEEVPTNRGHRLSFERLLQAPRAETEKISAFLGIDFHPGMLEPYGDPRPRMAEGLREGSRMLGDVNFHRHREIDVAAVDQWRTALDEKDLSNLTASLAIRLGYELPRESAAEKVPVTATISNSSAADHGYPMSSGQLRLWFIYQMDSDAGTYHMPVALRIRGPLDAAALAECHREIIRRHGTLRTRFATVRQTPLQIVAEQVEFDLPLIDVSKLPLEDRHTEAQRIVKDYTQRPFDLSRCPLLRAALIRLSNEDHLWVLTIHHIVSDGWSMSVFVREMSSLYRTYSLREANSLPELSTQYVDYAARQAAWLSSEESEVQISYWRKALAGIPSFIPLPYDRPRPPVQTNRGARVRFSFDSKLSARVKRLARESGSTLFTTLLAGFCALVSRYSGLDDIVVGTPTAGRHRPEFAQLIGFFVNTLVLRVDLSSDPTFLELLRQTRRVFLDALQHQDVPFEKLVEALRPPRSLSHTPVFQVMFGLRNIDTGEIDWPGLDLELVDLDHETAAFDLTLLMKETADGLIGDFEYNTDLFDESTIVEFGRRLEVLFREWAVRPDRRLSKIDLLEAEETTLLLKKWSADSSKIQTPVIPSVHDLFIDQVNRSPEAIAVTEISSDRHALTYAGLNCRADRLAKLLVQHGAGPEVGVGLCAVRSPEMIVALLAILKAGAFYVPLDPRYPWERIEFMIRDAGLRLLLSSDCFPHNLPESGITVISFDKISALANDHAPAILEDQVQERIYDLNLTPSKALPENLAYLIYTSGSTGRPKAVMVERGALTAFLLNATKHYGINRADRVLQFASLSFDAALEEIFTTLISGGTLLLRDEQMLDDIESFLDICGRRRVTVLDLPTMFWHRIAAELPALRVPESIRIVIIGGEQVHGPHVEKWRGSGLAQVRLVNSYGPTETAVVATCHELSGPDVSGRGQSTALIGRGLVHTRIYVLDKFLRPVPFGISGEICIGGLAIGRGYRDRPELTAERFLPDPFSGVSGSRLYRTGDRARSRPDGTLEFLGRLDQQVKIRGFRIELGEIESALTAHPDVAETAVIAPEDENGNKRLAAYVVLRAGATASAEALGAWLSQRLPNYMMPSSIIELAAMPVNVSGKADIAALSSVTANRTREKKEVSAEPRNEAEATLAEIWKEVLRIERVGIFDNFFEQGGDSILSLQVVARAREAGLRITSRQVFEQQTIAQLASVAKDLEGRNGLPEAISTFPLTPIQRWFFDQSFVDAHHFNQAVLLELKPSVTPQRLTSALDFLIRKHDALRLQFHRELTDMIATIASVDSIPTAVELVDFRGLPLDEQQSAIERRSAEFQASLSLECGQITRMVLFRLNDESARLLWVIHHLAVDAVSWGILLRDLEVALSTSSNDKRPEPVRPSISFSAWAHGLAQYANSHACEREIDYWLQLRRKRISPLPLDNGTANRKEQSRGTAGVIMAELTVEETASLIDGIVTAKQCGMNDVLLTTLVRAFIDWTGERQLLVEIESHGRDEILPGIDLSGTVGWFTTVYPVYLTGDERVPALEDLRSIQGQLRSIPCKGFHYGILRYLHQETSVRDRIGSLPQAEVLFNYFGRLDLSLPESPLLLRRAHEQPGPMSSPLQRRTHLIEINTWISNHRLTAAWGYHPKLHNPATIERLSSAFAGELRSLIASIELPSAEKDGVNFQENLEPQQRSKLSVVLSKKGERNRAAAE
jgi:amino acid adenylation domain-containing protein/non-ribosomal peptide synthase protein (TIGR01720 family)